MKRHFVWDEKLEKLVEVVRRPAMRKSQKDSGSVAMEVAPDQVAHANKYLKAMGVRGAHYKKDGTPVLTSAKARNETMMALGLFNRDAGYSEPTRGDARRFLMNRLEIVQRFQEE